MEEEDVYLRLTEKGRQALIIAFKNVIEKEKENIEENIKIITEDIRIGTGIVKEEWNKIIGKSEVSVIK